MTRRPKSASETFVRAAVGTGANALMRKAGFKRPGGGWRYYRERPWIEASPLRDEVLVSASWPSRGTGELELQLRSAAPHASALRSHEVRFPLDVLGDPLDLAVWLNHWLRTEGLPWFDRPLDLVALAQEAEASRPRLEWTDWDTHRIASLWRLAGRPEEAERLEASLRLRPAPTDADAPF
ncbi:MAG: hypothetical protein JNJ54_36585 [Myxococcaceae bacterium]|nr:hypothetical protein [Myxococcaceae bacterium]